jgi:hypothetical protein
MAARAAAWAEPQNSDCSGAVKNDRIVGEYIWMSWIDRFASGCRRSTSR